MQAMKSTITQLYDYRQSVIPQDLRRWHASEEEIQAQLEVLSRNHAFERDAEEVRTGDSVACKGESGAERWNRETLLVYPGRGLMPALEEAVRLGCGTILTSGQAPSAPEGQALLRELFICGAGRIDLMAGAGVKRQNILEIHSNTGIRVFHTSARTGAADSGMVYRREGVSMGLPTLSEYEVWRTDEREFRACAELVHSLEGEEGRQW